VIFICGNSEAVARCRLSCSSLWGASYLVALLLRSQAVAATFTDVTVSAGLTHNQAASGSGHPMTGGAAAGE
jgi:hypothetical protein